MKRTVNYVYYDKIMAIVENHIEVLAKDLADLQRELRDYLGPETKNMSLAVAKIEFLKIAGDATTDESVKKDIYKKIRQIDSVMCIMNYYNRMLKEIKQV